jgi:hypothetical protein
MSDELSRRLQSLSVSDSVSEKYPVKGSSGTPQPIQNLFTTLEVNGPDVQGYDDGSSRLNQVQWNALAEKFTEIHEGNIPTALEVRIIIAGNCTGVAISYASDGDGDSTIYTDTYSIRGTSVEVEDRHRYEGLRLADQTARIIESVHVGRLDEAIALYGRATYGGDEQLKDARGRKPSEISNIIEFYYQLGARNVTSWGNVSYALLDGWASGERPLINGVLGHKRFGEFRKNILMYIVACPLSEASFSDLGRSDVERGWAVQYLQFLQREGEVHGPETVGKLCNFAKSAIALARGHDFEQGPVPQAIAVARQIYATLENGDHAKNGGPGFVYDPGNFPIIVDFLEALQAVPEAGRGKRGFASKCTDIALEEKIEMWKRIIEYWKQKPEDAGANLEAIRQKYWTLHHSSSGRT